MVGLNASAFPRAFRVDLANRQCRRRTNRIGIGERGGRVSASRSCGQPVSGCSGRLTLPAWEPSIFCDWVTSWSVSPISAARWLLLHRVYRSPGFAVILISRRGRFRRARFRNPPFRPIVAWACRDFGRTAAAIAVGRTPKPRPPKVRCRGRGSVPLDFFGAVALGAEGRGFRKRRVPKARGFRRRGVPRRGFRRRQGTDDAGASRG